MIASQEFQRIYSEIRLLMQAELYEAAYHALPELETFVMTSRQTAIYNSLEDFLVEKLDEPEDLDDTAFH